MSLKEKQKPQIVEPNKDGELLVSNKEENADKKENADKTE